MKRYIAGINAESAAGPGWANSYLTIIWRYPDGRTEDETVYLEEMAPDLRTLFPHLLGLQGAVRKEIEAGRIKRRKGKKP